MNYTANIAIGDLLTRPKWPGIEHMGVFAGNNLVCHNTPIRGEHLSTLQEFAAGQPVKIQRTGANQGEVIVRMNGVMTNPKGYDAINRNCQHTAFEIIWGIAKSPFVLTIICLLAIGGLLWAISRR